jgi:alkylation response protein AidB-like acyl-CoA dehydrogenase
MSVFAETEDQELFERATARFLETHYPMARVRELAGEASTFEPERWREAAQLGWTTLLVPETAGGGSISGNGLADLLVVASWFGRHAAPGPLLGTNAVGAALGWWGSPEQQSGPLAELVAGDAVAAWAQRTVAATESGDTVVVHGRVGAVEYAADSAYLLVAADEAAGRSQFLVPLDAPGVERAPLRSLDLTRRFDDVTLSDVAVPADARVGPPGAADEQDAHLLDVVAVLAVGEIVGAMDRAFEITLDWTTNRYSFGRPLNSYQEIKHRMADLRTQREAAEAVAARAAFAVGTGATDGREWASAAMAYTGKVGPELVQDCIQLHGGIGVTADHDLHVFLRRAALDANLYGTAAEFAQRLGRLVAAAEAGVAA